MKRFDVQPVFSVYAGDQAEAWLLVHDLLKKHFPDPCGKTDHPDVTLETIDEPIEDLEYTEHTEEVTS